MKKMSQAGQKRGSWPKPAMTALIEEGRFGGMVYTKRGNLAGRSHGFWLNLFDAYCRLRVLRFYALQGTQLERSQNVNALWFRDYQ